MQPATVQVFISSTSLDLKLERKAVEMALQRMRETRFVGMEYFGSRDQTTRQASLDEVDRSQVYIGIFGERFGSGITEDEYRRARELSLPCFPYFKDEATIAAEWRDTEPAIAARLTALKVELRRAHTVPVFTSPEDLAAQVTADLHRWLFDQYLSPQLEQAVRGERPREEAQSLVDAIKDFDSLPTDLLQRLRGAGYMLAFGAGSMSIGDVNLTNTGSGSTITGSISIRGDGNAVGAGNNTSVTKTMATRQRVEPADFTALIAEMRDLLHDSSLDEDDHGIVDSNLKTVEREVKKARPRLPLIESALKNIESLLSTTETIGSAAGIVPLIPRAIELAQYLLS